MRYLVVSLSIVSLTACGASGSGDASVTTTPIALDDAIGHWSSAGLSRPPASTRRSPSRAAPARSARADSHGGVSFADRPLPMRARRRLVDVQMRDADLENALRMLADTAGVPLVVDGEVEGTVTIHLRRVDPLRAIAIIAATHGARVETSHGTLVVRRQ